MTSTATRIGGDRLPTDIWDSRLRLQTTVRLRWFAVIGQTLAVALIAFGLRFSLPLGPCLAFIACSAWLNVFLRMRYPSRHRLSTELASGLLVYDVVQLAALIYLTGGIQNPFIVLLVAPVTVSASTLAPRNTVLIGAVAVIAAALLVHFHLPLPWDDSAPFAGPLTMPLLYNLGILAAIASCLTFLGLYTWRLSKEARQMTGALAATEMVLAHEQKLHALDGLAAAAAHELGTPLATIVLVTKELARDIPVGSPLREDIELLTSQAQRCREILHKLTQSPEEQDPLHASLSIGQLLDEAADPYRRGKVEILIDAGPAMMQTGGGSGGQEPVGERRPGLIHGLGNIIENAVDFAHAKVEITARWSDREVSIVVADDGPGFAPDILDTIGEPYVTTRAGGRAGQSKPAARHAGGLGLGFFIAKTLLERSGATVSFGNRSGGGQGAVVKIGWPRTSFEAQVRQWGTPAAGPASGPGSYGP